MFERVTALHFAAFWKDGDLGKEVAYKLPDKCGGPQKQQELANAQDKDGCTPLHWASEFDDTDICEILVDCGTRLDARDNDDKTALHLAVQKAKVKVINVFMKYPQITEIVDLKDNEGNSPLDIAIANSDIELQLVAKLLSKSKQPEIYFNKVDREQLLIQSLLHGCPNNVEKLLENGTKLPDTEERKTALHLAAMCEEEDKAMEAVDIILEKNADKEKLVCKSDKRGRTALHEAALSGHKYLCRKLLDINPKIIDMKDRDGRNPLYAAVEGKQNEEKVLKILLEAYPDKDTVLNALIDRSGLTPLQLAASRGKSNLVKVLLSTEEKSSKYFKRGAPPQGKRDRLKGLHSKKEGRAQYLKRGDFLGQTALHKAAKCGDIDTVNIFLERGAQPLKERDCDGRTALHYAVQAKTGQDKIKLVKSLLEGCKSDEEKLLLLWASAAGLGTADQNLSSGDAVQIFLKSEKKDITKIQEHRTGNTNLLKIAASMGDMEMTKELISRGYQIADIQDQEWINKLTSQQEKNVKMVSRQLERIAEQANDQPTISDNLGRLDYAHGLAALLLNPYLNPPIVVGISGSWGMGKSSLMAQTESILLKTASQMALLPSSKLSSSALEVPEIKTFALSKKGIKKYEEIKRQVDNVLSKKEIKKYDENKGQVDKEEKDNKSSFRTMMDKIGSWRKKSKTQADTEHKCNKNYFAAMMDKIRSWRKYSEKQESQAENELAEQDSLSQFLNNYDVQYRKIFKSFAAMDSTDMFTRRPREDQEHQKSKSKNIWDKIKVMWDVFTPNVQHSKTSAQQSKSDSLEEGSVPAILTVQYNAWKYRNETEALAGMAVEITKELEEVMTQAQWLSTCWRNSWKQKKYNMWIEIIYPCLLAIVLACTFTWIVWVMLERYKFKDWAKTKYACVLAAIVIIGWTLTKSVMGILKPVSTQLMNYISFPDHTDKLGYQERVISDINFLKYEISKKPLMVFSAFSWVFTAISALWLLITECLVMSLFSHPECIGKTITIPKVAPASGTNLRIIVFIDDLDQCQESVILQVLSAINLVLAVCEINVVLGIDKDLIERAIIKKYGDMKSIKSFKDSQELADKYLQKIIQLPLDLPDPSEEQSRKFLEGQLGILQEPSKDADSESKMDAHVTNELSRKTSMPGARMLRRNDTEKEIAPEIIPDPQVAIEIGREADASTSVPSQTGTEALPEIDVARNKDAGNRISNRNTWFSFTIREMLFVRYSEGEQVAFCYFQRLATDCRKLPQEWKCLLNYHRLVWYIFSVSEEARDLAGWQVQLITWIFICWEWQENMNLVIQNWNWNNICVLKTQESQGPSLEMIVEHFIECESNKNMKVTVASNEVKEMRRIRPEVGVPKDRAIEIENINREQKKLEKSAKDDVAREATGPPVSCKKEELKKKSRRW